MARACPQCGAPLQRLSGADGHLVIRAFAIDDRGQWMSGRIVQVPKRLDAVYACPRCEYAESGGAPCA